MNSLIKKIKSKVGQSALLSDKWNIGFVTDDINNVIKSEKLDIHWLKHNYKDRWFADPFLLEVTDSKVVVLVEEYRYKTRIGRIARLEISRSDFVLLDLKIILEEPYHLSFPVIFRKDGEVFVMPECALSGGLNIYKYDAHRYRLEKVGAVADLPLSDATIVRMENGEDYVFSTSMPNPNGSTLQIYSFDEQIMKIVEKPVAKFVFESNIARNAGDAFYVDGQLYRPAQDCNKWYGNGLNIQKVIKDGDHFAFETVNTFHSDNPSYALGYHTLNMKNSLIVVDGHRYRFPFIAKILMAASHILSVSTQRRTLQ